MFTIFMLRPGSEIVTTATEAVMSLPTSSIQAGIIYSLCVIIWLRKRIAVTPVAAYESLRNLRMGKINNAETKKSVKSW